MAIDTALADWLLDSDPALRWQVERDVVGAPPEVWRATRARVRTEGFGARLLALQDADGQWDGGAFFPGGFDGSDGSDGSDADAGSDVAGGQPWTATSWSLAKLREWGVDASALDGTADLLARNSRWEYDGSPYWQGEVDCCINAATLASGTWLGADVDGLAGWFLDHRLPDGGWNCEWVAGSTRSSFHSTLNVIVALLDREQRIGATPVFRAARHGAEEYLLERHLLRRLSTGESVGDFTTHFAYPFRWTYSVLRAADHFRTASLHDRTAPDPRLADAVAVIRDERNPDGTWTQELRHPGRDWFEVDAPPGEPSRWLTLIGTRVLAWWDGAG